MLCFFLALIILVKGLLRLVAWSTQILRGNIFRIPFRDGNRLLDNGTIIAGPFLIVGDAGEDFCSLTDEQAAYYMHRFQEPEEISQEEVEADTGFIFYSF